MREPIDDLLAKIPEDWDFHIHSFWDDEGRELFEAILQERATGEFEHFGHYLREIIKESNSLRTALELAISDMEKLKNAA